MSSAATTRSSDQLLFTGYDPGPFYDELIAPNGEPRPWAAAMFEKLAAMPLDVFEERRKLADLSYLVQGITFTVYSDGRGTERLFPFDLCPRIIPRSEWDVIERGLAQRVMALNLYLQDIYGPQRITIVTTSEARSDNRKMNSTTVTSSAPSPRLWNTVSSVVSTRSVRS